ncbi:hypothetical protein OMAG_001625 [Candidatus Omnitrophus magneticus]|uniref:Uncharacterized protein n=1 Tax=Candidatus Omnitrophus magneticus TaxID=1609969 RepID=A0A0F0CSL4_9BACT|nr:hypothetical protein OMAG_001625 [Candidatus Omnitrophus magneticus]
MFQTRAHYNDFFTVFARSFLPEKKEEGAYSFFSSQSFEKTARLNKEQRLFWVYKRKILTKKKARV